jgi:CRISPR type III-B/RAMP module RAMP protein Cmr1
MRKQYDLKFITPAFCSGADQSKAEIRATSIIGELRWWFRVVNGCENESALFGGIADGKAKKSKITVRILNKNIISDVKDLPSMRMGQPLSYLLYYANVSGKTTGEKHGPRFKQNGFLSPGTTFSLLISTRNNLSETLQIQFEQALNAFLTFGSIGLRSTRTCGAFVDENNILSFEEFKSASGKCGDSKVYWVVDQENAPAYQEGCFSAMCILESLLKKIRKAHPAGKGGENLTPLGSAGNKRENVDRQRSALKLRPVKLREGVLPVVIYSDSVLDPKCGTLNCDVVEFNHPFDPRNSQSGKLYSLI